MGFCTQGFQLGAQSTVRTAFSERCDTQAGWSWENGRFACSDANKPRLNQRPRETRSGPGDPYGKPRSQRDCGVTTAALPVATHAPQHQHWTATALAEPHSLGRHRRRAHAPTARMRDLGVAFSQQPPALSSLWRIQTLATSATALTGHSSPCVRFSPVAPSAVPFAATPLPLIGPHRPQSPPSCPQTTPPPTFSRASARRPKV